MKLYGAFTDMESAPDLFVAFATSQLLKDLGFSLRECRTRNRFCQLQGNLWWKEAFTFSYATYCFPDLFRICHFYQETFCPGACRLANIFFTIVTCDYDNPRSGSVL
jgi:hypothetical protein